MGWTAAPDVLQVKRASVLECGGRAQRRHRFRADGRFSTRPRFPCVRKRREAKRHAAVHMPERARHRAQQSPKRQAAANFPKRRLCGRCCGRDGRTPPRLARGGAALDGIIKFLAAGAAGARALAGGRGSGHKFQTRRCGRESRTNSLKDSASNSRLASQKSTDLSMLQRSLSVGIHWLSKTDFLSCRR